MMGITWSPRKPILKGISATAYITAAEEMQSQYIFRLSSGYIIHRTGVVLYKRSGLSKRKRDQQGANFTIIICCIWIIEVKKHMYLSLCFITMPPPWFGRSNEVIAVTLRWFLNVADSIDSAPKKLWPVDVWRIIRTTLVGSAFFRTIFLRHWSNGLKPSTRTLSRCEIHFVDIPVFLSSVILSWMARVPHTTAEGFSSWKLLDAEHDLPNLLIDVWCFRYRIGYEECVLLQAVTAEQQQLPCSFPDSFIFFFLFLALKNAKKKLSSSENSKTPFWNWIRIFAFPTPPTSLYTLHPNYVPNIKTDNC